MLRLVKDYFYICVERDFFRVQNTLDLKEYILIFIIADAIIISICNNCVFKVT